MKKILLLVVVSIISACSSSGQSTYYWHKDGYGADQFGKDQEYCMTDADFFPYNTKASWIGPNTLNLQPKFTSDYGIWSYYEPYKGAQPVYVNYSRGDYTVREKGYKNCMEELGYTQKYKRYENREIGTLKCNTVNCERDDYKDGIYKEYQPR